MKKEVHKRESSEGVYEPVMKSKTPVIRSLFENWRRGDRASDTLQKVPKTEDVYKFSEIVNPESERFL